MRAAARYPPRARVGSPCSIFSASRRCCSAWASCDPVVAEAGGGGGLVCLAVAILSAQPTRRTAFPNAASANKHLLETQLPFHLGRVSRDLTAFPPYIH